MGNYEEVCPSSEWEYTGKLLSAYCDDQRMYFFNVTTVINRFDGCVGYIVIGNDRNIYGAFKTFEEADRFAKKSACNMSGTSGGWL